MTTRHLIGYLLLLLMIAAGCYAIWWAIYNSERSVRRRERRARRARREQTAQDAAAADQETGPIE